MQKFDNEFLNEAIKQFNSYQTTPLPLEVMTFVFERIEHHIQEKNDDKVAEYLTKMKWLSSFHSPSFDPIKNAIKAKSTSIVQLLVENGFQPSSSDNCVKLAMEEQQFLSAVYLLEHGGIPGGITKENYPEDVFERNNTFVEFLD